MLYLPGEEDHGSIQQLLWQRERAQGEVGEQQWRQGEDAAPEICTGTKKVDTLLRFCTCMFCQPFSCWKSVPLNVFRLRNEVIPNARLTLVERSPPLSPQLREVLSRRCV